MIVHRCLRPQLLEPGWIGGSIPDCVVNAPVAETMMNQPGTNFQMSLMTRYEIVLYWSDADQAFIAEVQELPRCAADGETRQEALPYAEVIIDEWLETARELERPIPEPKSRPNIFAWTRIGESIAPRTTCT